MNTNNNNVTIDKNTAYAEAAHWDGMKLDLKFNENRVYPKGKDVRIIGSDADTHLDLHMEIGCVDEEVAIDHEGFLTVVKGGVQVLLAVIRTQPGIIRDLLGFAFDAIKLAYEAKLRNLDVKHLEAEERLLRTKMEVEKKATTRKAPPSK